MIAAIYARKSTDQVGVADEDRSVTRQIEHATAFALKNGWTVLPDYTYVDDGISGAEFRTRAGFMRMMNALQPHSPFQVLIMSEESRLGRESIEVSYALKQLITAGVRVFCYLTGQERTLDSPIEKAMLALQTMSDEMERQKSAVRTFDAMVRKARQGHVTGGAACFGYDNIAVMGPDGKRSHVERCINEAEAAIVRRIFAESIAGYGYSRIARGLTADRAPCPRPQQGRPAGWGPSTVYEILHRDLYRGIVIWNKTRKRDRWGQSRTIARPESEWLRVERPELRIVSEEVWAAAHERLSTIRTRLETARGGRPIVRRDVDSQYMLSGFARCAQCGGTLSVLSRGNRERVYLYGCLANHKRGQMVCSNTLTMPVKDVDDAVLKELGGDTLRPAVVKAIVAAVFDAMEPAAARANAEAMHADLRTLDQKIRNLTAAIENGAAAAPLVQQLAARQKERDELLAAVARAEANADLVLDRKTIERKVLDQVETWRALLTGNIADGRQLLREVLEEPLRFTPEGKAYRFEGRVATGRLITGLVSPVHLVWRALQDSNLRPPGS